MSYLCRITTTGQVANHVLKGFPNPAKNTYFASISYKPNGDVLAVDPEDPTHKAILEKAPVDAGVFKLELIPIGNQRP